MSGSKNSDAGSSVGGARFVLDAVPLTLEALDGALGRRIGVDVSDNAWRRIEAGHAAVGRIADLDQPAYGINTGFGHLCTKRIPPDQIQRLQINLVESHAVGVGDPVPPEVVRLMMLLKVASLAHGVSGVARSTVECLQRMMEADLLPVIPRQGSLGASGDLAPLAHMVLPMIGQGEVVLDGVPMAAQKALAQCGIEPVTLGPKEGLALINGTQLMSAYAAAIVIRARRLAKQADVIAAMSLDAMMGSVKPFDSRLHHLRPHAGAIEVAQNVRRLMSQSEILASHADCDRVQDPYSLRCIPQVHGASRDALRHVGQVVDTEINSVTDNPLILDEDDVISGGLFHGQPLALGLDYLAIALAEFASISERRTYVMLSGVAGLPELLVKQSGVNSGLMVPHYTAAALVSENKGLCMPASVDSIPTSLGQEDHVSMGARSAVKCFDVLQNAETVLAIEQFCAAQALDYRAPLKPGVGPRVAHEEIRKKISHASEDRRFSHDIALSLSLLRSQHVVHAVEREIGSLA
jgi:histidine ammonia-lyase